MHAARNDLAAHYTRGDLPDRIDAALRLLADDSGVPDPSRFARFDEFHIGGRAMTEQLANRAGIAADHHVLDLGCGLGGPARTLHHLTGCRVTGLDVTPAFCRVGARLNELAGCADSITLIEGDALALPFDDQSFDAIWLQHMTMNIPNARLGDLFAGMARVLKPGGVLALHEIVAGAEPMVHFPVPWASEPAQSHLTPLEELLKEARAAGFAIEDCDDLTDAAIAWFETMLNAPPADAADRATPPVNLSTVMGPSFPTMAKNLLRTLREDRARVMMTTARLKRSRS